MLSDEDLENKIAKILDESLWAHDGVNFVDVQGK